MNTTSSLGINGPLLLLITCYALLAILVLALLLYTRWSYWIKTLTIVLMGAVILLTYDTMTALLGFPTPGKLPDRFLLHYSVIVQPDKNTSSKGMIYLWASELTREGPTCWVCPICIMPCLVRRLASTNELLASLSQGIS